MPTDPAEAYRRGVELIETRKLRQAIELLESIEFAPDVDDETQPLARLALADSRFYQIGNLSLIDARSLYLDFVTLHGDHPLAPYAQLQAGLCSLKQVNNASRDQTQTYQAIADLRQIEVRFPRSKYVDAARMMLRVAESNLAEAEFLVGQFYLRRSAYLAASRRFLRILDNYPTYVALDKVYYNLGVAMIKSDNEPEARLYLGKLVEDFVDGPYVKLGREALAQLGDDVNVQARAERAVNQN